MPHGQMLIISYKVYGGGFDKLIAVFYNYSADLIWRTKMPGFAPAHKEDRSFSAFFPFRACPAPFTGTGGRWNTQLALMFNWVFPQPPRAEKGENVDFPNEAE